MSIFSRISSRLLERKPLLVKGPLDEVLYFERSLDVSGGLEEVVDEEAEEVTGGLEEVAAEETEDVAAEETEEVMSGFDCATEEVPCE